jgi:hypothetical protein
MQICKKAPFAIHSQGHLRMTKKNEKRLCWNCEGNISQHISQCIYCGVDLTQPMVRNEENVFKGFTTPFQTQGIDQEIPQPPYATASTKEISVTDEEWNAALHADKEAGQKESAPTRQKDMIAFLLLFPGIIFFLFALVLIFFSSDGVLALQWNRNVAYFYFLGAAPLLFLGWRTFRL